MLFVIVSVYQVAFRASRTSCVGYLFRDEGAEYAARMIDLKDASRDDLIRLVVTQHQTIARQERVIAAQQARIAALEATVAQGSARVDASLATIDALGRGDGGTAS